MSVITRYVMDLSICEAAIRKHVELSVQLNKPDGYISKVFGNDDGLQIR